MFQKFGEAIRLLISNLVLFSQIILTVWLPGSILSNYLKYNVSNTLDLGGLIEVIFGPIYVGAIVYALFKLKQDQDVNYSEAIAVGFRNWGRLFRARCVTGLVIGLGFVALIIPGIILLVRYALIDSVVILEPNAEEMKRSSELTKGKRWQILGEIVLFTLAFLVLLFIFRAPLESLKQIDNIFISIALDCVLNIFYGVIEIEMFLFYWESREKEQSIRNGMRLPITPR